jgi:hypothetical protein
VNEFSVILEINTEMQQDPMTFVDYIFRKGPDGSIFFDEELNPDQLGVKDGDRFEVVLVPGVGLVFQKMVGQVGLEPTTKGL